MEGKLIGWQHGYFEYLGIEIVAQRIKIKNALEKQTWRRIEF